MFISVSEANGVFFVYAYDNDNDDENNDNDTDGRRSISVPPTSNDRRYRTQHVRDRNVRDCAVDTGVTFFFVE